MTTALIIRNPSTPSPHVLEVDGPRRQYTQRGEGSYYLATDNQPRIIFGDLFQYDAESDPALNTNWEAEHWELYQHNDGTFEFHACRPTEAEILEGDLHGALGSVIRFTPTRTAYRNAFRVARRLLRANLKIGCVINRRDLVGITSISNGIPACYVYTPISDL